MQGARREHPLYGAVTDEQRRSRPGAAPPLRAGALLTSGFVARQSQSESYAPSSRLARSQNGRQQNRKLFLIGPLMGLLGAVFISLDRVDPLGAPVPFDK